MLSRTFLVLSIIFSLYVVFVVSQALDDKKPLNVFLVPHSHWDVGWLKTPPQYYQDKVRKIINSVVSAVEKNTTRRFIFSEIAYMELWWEEATYEQKQTFQKLLREKRIEFVLGGWTMPDEALNTNTALIQTMTRGHEWIRDTFGEQYIPKTAWRIDPFGLVDTMTKIYKDCGLENTVIARVPYSIMNERRSKRQLEFGWKLSDGSKMFTHIMDISYCILNPFEQWQYWLTDSKAQDFMKEIEKRRGGYNTGHFLMPLGCDFTWDDENHETWDNIEPVIDYINEKHGDKYKIHFSLLSDYMNTILGPNQENLSKFSEYEGDFLPYADNIDSYWTGYYSSYPLLKQEARKAESVLRTTNILYAISPDNTTMRDLEQLRKIISDVTHHDGITGTSKREVVYGYYIPNLLKSISACQLRNAEALQRLAKYDSFTYKPVEITADKQSNTPIIAFNSLGWNTHSMVTVDIVTGNYPVCVIDSESNILIESQIIDNGSNTQLVFPGQIPAIGFKTFFIKHNCDNGIRKDQPKIQTFDFTIVNDKLEVTFCNSSGYIRLCHMKQKEENLDIDVKHEYLGYTGVTWGQASGAYIFRPNGEQPIAIQVMDAKTVLYEGQVCKRVEQILNGYLNHVFTLCNGQNYMDIETSFGSTPAGLEIVSRFTTNFNNSRILYCDKYGTETRKMQFPNTGIATADIAGSFIPMTSHCFIRDTHDDIAPQLTIFSTQSYGVASTTFGSLEIMLYRRTVNDDGRGVKEPLNDHKPFVSKIRMRVDKIRNMYNSAKVVFPHESITFNNPITVVTGSLIHSNYSGIKSYSSPELPHSIHLLSYDVSMNRNYSEISFINRPATAIVRLQYLGTELNTTVDVSRIFSSLGIKLAEELTLSASKKLSTNVIENLQKNQIKTFRVTKVQLLKNTNIQPVKIFSTILIITSIIVILLLTYINILYWMKWRKMERQRLTNDIMVS